jgi:hypothetical protein
MITEKVTVFSSTFRLRQPLAGSPSGWPASALLCKMLGRTLLIIQ